MTFVRELPIFDVIPTLRLPVVSLGEWPTPLDSCDELAAAVGARGPALIKRDDLSSPIYGGNKVRCLEVLFGEALEMGATHIEAMGAFGTNHGVATILHAPRVGLEPGAILFPQPRSTTAADNLETLAGASTELHAIPHWSLLPLAALARRVRLHARSPYMMAPGGATPRGALAYASAALELAIQIKAESQPIPRAIVVGAGSTCTAAGLLAGTTLAHRLGLLSRRPRIVAVRVTPWPVTSKLRIARLAHLCSLELARSAGDPSLELSIRELLPHLEVDGTQLGRGYGYPTAAGRHAIELFERFAGFSLDTTYSAKAAASFLERLTEPGPLLFWSTKSTAPLPPPILQPASALQSWIDAARS